MFFIGYPPSGDQPAKIHRIKPAPTSTTTPESANLPETSTSLARLVSTEESKMQGVDDMASSTTPSTTVGNLPIHKVPKSVVNSDDPITIRIEETASSSSPSISLNSNNRLESSNNNNCQNYQHLVGILSNPPIAQNSLMVAAAADAVAAPQDHNDELQNQPIPLSPPLNPEHVLQLSWNRPQNYYEGNILSHITGQT